MDFIKRENLKRADATLILVYLGLIVLVFTFLFFVKTAYNQRILLGYIVLSHSAIYGVFCRGLRYATANFVWLFISVLHILFFFLLKDDQLLVPKIGGTTASPLFYTWVLVLTLQATRFISLKVFKKELVTIFAYGTPLFGNATPETSDWVLCAPNFIAFLLVLMA